MPDLDKVAQCAALAKALWFLAAPARSQAAVGLYDLGVRVHPELASKHLVAQGPAGMGEHRRQQLAAISSPDQVMAIVRRFAPEMAARIDAAETEEQRAAALAEIRRRHPNLIADAERRLAAVDPDDLG